MDRRRTMLCALGAVLAVLAIAPAAHAAEPGLNVGGDFFSSGPTFRAIADSGPHWVRFFAFWQTLEPGRGQYDTGTLTAYDNAIAALPRGTKVLLVVVGSPRWETGSSDIHTPPRDPADYANFVSYLASHFGSSVGAYEIWNEEDAPIWWTGNADQYAGLLRAAYPAIKAAAPAATVVMGGLTGNDAGFISHVYDAGGGGNFDAASDHTDTACNLKSPADYFLDPGGAIDQFSFLGYRSVHDVMVARGDGAKPIWLTEMGWNTTSTVCDSGMFKGEKAGGVSEASQAQYLSQAYHCLAQDPYVAVAFWFQLQDSGTTDTSQNRYGLLRSDFSRKPSFGAYQDYTSRGDQLSGPCGDFSLPRITVMAPVAGSSYRGPLLIKVAATSTRGVSEIQLRYDGGTRITNFLAHVKPRPQNLAGQINWQHGKHLSPGKHTIIVTVIDALGGKATSTVVVNHLGGSQLTYKRVRHHHGKKKSKK